MTALQKQLHQQETLLNSYQQENERLYKELKDKSEDMKKIEGKMFEENQKLGNIVKFAKTRNQSYIFWIEQSNHECVNKKKFYFNF